MNIQLELSRRKQIKKKLTIMYKINIFTKPKLTLLCITSIKISMRRMMDLSAAPYNQHSGYYIINNALNN